MKKIVFLCCMLLVLFGLSNAQADTITFSVYQDVWIISSFHDDNHGDSGAVSIENSASQDRYGMLGFDGSGLVSLVGAGDTLTI